MTTENATLEVSHFEGFFLSETSVLELKNPKGKPLLFGGEPVKVHLFGPSTAQHRAAKLALDREATKRVMAAVNVKADADTDDGEADPKFLTAVTSHFENFPFPGGTAAIYREPRLMYINNQVQAHLASLGNFFKGGETT